MNAAKTTHDKQGCNDFLLPIKDALDILSGKWKIPIIGSLMFGNKRFKEISKEINGITDRMLSKELKELEMNHLINRTVYDTFPPTVEYAITPHGQSLQKVMLALAEWGKVHRKKIMNKTK